MKSTDVLKEPVLTEKGTAQAARGVYMFRVHQAANKYQIKSSLEKLYEVTVGKVRIQNRVGKVRKSGKRMQAKQLPGSKIAYVTVTKGKIDIFPQT